MQDFAAALEEYNYAFPQELIAVAPAHPRDSAKLLVHNRKTGTSDRTTFREIGTFLPPKALLVLNQTKVIPARLDLARASGGRVQVLSLGIANGMVRVMANRKLKIGEVLTVDAEYSFTVMSEDEKYWLLTPNFDVKQLEKLFEQSGHTPLPPYIKDSPLTEEERRREYQSVFAKDEGSIAAPTASLHFTEELLEKLQANGIELAYTTLHVHLGTFAPLTDAQWQSGTLHIEKYEIDAVAIGQIEAAKRAKRPIIAVGTTVVRTLESAMDEHGNIVRPRGETSLFIRDEYPFKAVDGLITNFHVPKSSLLMLVSTLVGRTTLLELYKQAIEKKFRLFSFGDAMLIV